MLAPCPITSLMYASCEAMDQVYGGAGVGSVFSVLVKALDFVVCWAWVIVLFAF